MMKPYIMNYSEELSLTTKSKLKDDGSTVLTFTVENQDQDELHLDWTLQTNTTEPTDNDSIFLIDDTTITKTLEPSDRDELYLDSTLQTRVIEPSDQDEMYLNDNLESKH